MRTCDHTGCHTEGWAYVGNGTWDDSVWHEEVLCAQHTRELLEAVHDNPPTEPAP